MVATSCNGFSARNPTPRPAPPRYRRSVRGALAASWPALRIFLWSRLAIWALAAGTVLLFEDELNPSRGRWDTPRLHELGAAVDVWARWDSNWYLRIAESGLQLAVQHAGVLPAAIRCPSPGSAARSAIASSLPG